MLLETSFDGGMNFTKIESFEFVELSLSFEELSTLTTLDFDEGDLAEGIIVNDQFKGVDISTSYPFSVMIFDTENSTGGDDELFAHEGNALIISGGRLF